MVFPLLAALAGIPFAPNPGGIFKPVQPNRKLTFRQTFRKNRIDKCKRSIRAWHATPTANVQTILREGFKPSKSGRLGPGVYFTNAFWKAKTIAKSKDNCSVIEVKIFTKGEMFNAGSQHFQSDRWQFPTGIAKGKHPKWAGIRKPFTEFVKKNARAMRIVRVHEM
jgi:hypothetical protein